MQPTTNQLVDIQNQTKNVTDIVMMEHAIQLIQIVC